MQSSADSGQWTVKPAAVNPGANSLFTAKPLTPAPPAGPPPLEFLYQSPQKELLEDEDKCYGYRGRDATSTTS